mmetsp:Transcript_15840/g.23311  ORF Transcript_15840/g.23311 Transcript_15840/m.23311 type:complete len:601 (+) Transcript_15840:130-1932(+)|eukprot:CAMPEP_0194206732 /NCGR_PEP_ID=MMETSP0156-20130528/5682_1 /TAXON_ID=33649 /ORGANISM="Thalassionema nitzschioides, Strain L26-B" /LENGTH=600 /DNA_ID=CAMNT_0038933333 /DNA_START=93 /DNA_END=1895 /DNA_ORIENTATION=-
MVTSGTALPAREDSSPSCHAPCTKAQQSLPLALVMASSFHQYQSDESGSNEILTNNSWEWEVLEQSKMSTGRTGCSAVVVENDSKSDEEIIVIGGSNSYWSQLNSLEVFDVRNQTWFLSDLVLHDSRWHCASVAFLPPNQHKILVIGGWNANSGILSSVELIDRDFQSVTQMSRLQQGRCKLAAVAISSTQILVAGGHDGVNSMDTLEVYDLTTNSWDLIPSSETLETPRSQCGAVLSDRKVYIAGGVNTLESLDTCDILNLDSFQILKGPTLQRPIENAQVLSIGANEQVIVLDDSSIQFLDVVTDQWVLVEIPMNDRRRAAAAVAIGLELFVIGGESSYTRHKNVEKLFLDIPQAPSVPSALSPQQVSQPDYGSLYQVTDQLSLQQKHLTELKNWIEEVNTQRNNQILELEGVQSRIISNQEILQSELQADIYKEEQALERALIKHQKAIAELQTKMELQQQNFQTVLIGLEMTRTIWIEKVNNQLECAKDRVSVIEFELRNEDHGKSTESADRRERNITDNPIFANNDDNASTGTSGQLPTTESKPMPSFEQSTREDIDRNNQNDNEPSDDNQIQVRVLSDEKGDRKETPEDGCIIS